MRLVKESCGVFDFVKVFKYEKIIFLNFLLLVVGDVEREVFFGVVVLIF